MPVIICHQYLNHKNTFYPIDCGLSNANHHYRRLSMQLTKHISVLSKLTRWFDSPIIDRQNVRYREKNKIRNIFKIFPPNRIINNIYWEKYKIYFLVSFQSLFGIHSKFYLYIRREEQKENSQSINRKRKICIQSTKAKAQARSSISNNNIS
jgi:hypothetical protein